MVTNPPGLVKYYVQGDTGVPTTKATVEDDEPTPNCTGFFFDDRPFLQRLVNGAVIGPAPQNQISVEFKLKKLKNRNGKEEIVDFIESSPRNESGKIMVILKNNKNLNIDSLNIESIRLGTGEAPVETSKILGEKNHEELRMIFDFKKIGIECDRDRDRVLYLIGKTRDDKTIFGAELIKTKCEIPSIKK